MKPISFKDLGEALTRRVETAPAPVSTPVTGAKAPTLTAREKMAHYGSPPHETLLQHLYAHLEHPEVMYARDSHRSPGLHVSGLAELCARRSAYAWRDAELKIERPSKSESPKAGDVMTQDLGKVLHDLWQNEYMGPAGLLMGTWHCVHCDFRTAPNSFMPKRAATHLRPGTASILCAAPEFRYREIGVCLEFVVGEQSMKVYGHTDGVVAETPWVPTSNKRVFEFKTKSPSQYQELRQPQFKHIIQVHGYMKGLGLKAAILVYMDKAKQCAWTKASGAFVSGPPRVKSFLVEFDDQFWKVIEERIYDYMRYTERTNKKLPIVPSDFPRICESQSCDLAQECDFAKVCFSESSGRS